MSTKLGKQPAILVKRYYLMKILLDPQIFNDQEYGGISRYYVEIFSRLKNKGKDVEVKVPVLYSKNVYLKESNLSDPKSASYTRYVNFMNKVGISIRKKIKKKNRELALKQICSNEFDLFVPTYFDPYFLDLIDNIPFVLTVYDMIHELFPQYFTDDNTTSTPENKLMLMEKATKIIAVSQNTKNDIIKVYPHIDPLKIEVIYHGNSIKVHPNVKVDLPSNYILFVGVREKYKNFIFFIDSIKDLLKNDPSLHVICAGGGKFKSDEISYIASLGLEKQILHKTFKENELGTFYKNAKCFVFPSMYEGFGIPVLESMACGCPIVLAKHSSFPEVAGDAGVYFDLNSPADLKSKIQQLLTDKNLRKEYSEKGLKQVEKFTWDKAAEQCFELYKKAIAN